MGVPEKLKTPWEVPPGVQPKRITRETTRGCTRKSTHPVRLPMGVRKQRTHPWDYAWGNQKVIMPMGSPMGIVEVAWTHFASLAAC